MSFLLDQFELLREQRIDVYWCGGPDDAPDAWPEAVLLPAHVHRFPGREITQVLHRRGETPLASLIGLSSDSSIVQAGDFRTEPSTRS